MSSQLSQSTEGFLDGDGTLTPDGLSNVPVSASNWNHRTQQGMWFRLSKLFTPMENFEDNCLTASIIISHKPLRGPEEILEQVNIPNIYTTAKGKVTGPVISCVTRNNVFGFRYLQVENFKIMTFRFQIKIDPSQDFEKLISWLERAAVPVIALPNKPSSTINPLALQESQTQRTVSALQFNESQILAQSQDPTLTESVCSGSGYNLLGAQKLGTQSSDSQTQTQTQTQETDSQPDRLGETLNTQNSMAIIAASVPQVRKYDEMNTDLLNTNGNDSQSLISSHDPNEALRKRFQYNEPKTKLVYYESPIDINCASLDSISTQALQQNSLSQLDQDTLSSAKTIPPYKGSFDRQMATVTDRKLTLTRFAVLPTPVNSQAQTFEKSQLISEAKAKPQLEDTTNLSIKNTNNNHNHNFHQNESSTNIRHQTRNVDANGNNTTVNQSCLDLNLVGPLAKPEQLTLQSFPDANDRFDQFNKIQDEFGMDTFKQFIEVYCGGNPGKIPNNSTGTTLEVEEVSDAGSNKKTDQVGEKLKQNNFESLQLVEKILEEEIKTIKECENQAQNQGVLSTSINNRQPLLAPNELSKPGNINITGPSNITINKNSINKPSQLHSVSSNSAKNITFRSPLITTTKTIPITPIITQKPPPRPIPNYRSHPMNYYLHSQTDQFVLQDPLVTKRGSTNTMSKPLESASILSASAVVSNKDVNNLSLNSCSSGIQKANSNAVSTASTVSTNIDNDYVVQKDIGQSIAKKSVSQQTSSNNPSAQSSTTAFSTSNKQTSNTPTSNTQTSNSNSNNTTTFLQPTQPVQPTQPLQLLTNQKDILKSRISQLIREPLFWKLVVELEKVWKEMAEGA